MKINAILQTILLVLIVWILAAQIVREAHHADLCKAAATELYKEYDRIVFNEGKATTGAGKERDITIMDQTFMSTQMLFMQQIMLMKGCEK